jgi:hypothetical protein
MGARRTMRRPRLVGAGAAARIFGAGKAVEKDDTLAMPHDECVKKGLLLCHAPPQTLGQIWLTVDWERDLILLEQVASLHTRFPPFLLLSGAANVMLKLSEPLRVHPVLGLHKPVIKLLSKIH